MDGADSSQSRPGRARQDVEPWRGTPLGPPRMSSPPKGGFFICGGYRVRARGSRWEGIPTSPVIKSLQLNFRRFSPNGRLRFGLLYGVFHVDDVFRGLLTGLAPRP